jgi:WD40 repeat protein
MIMRINVNIIKTVLLLFFTFCLYSCVKNIDTTDSLHDIIKKEEILLSNKHDYFSSLAFSHNNKYLAFGNSLDGYIAIFDLAIKKEVKRLTTPYKKIDTIAFSSNNNNLFAYSESTKIKTTNKNIEFYNNRNKLTEFNISSVTQRDIFENNIVEAHFQTIFSPSGDYCISRTSPSDDYSVYNLKESKKITNYQLESMEDLIFNHDDTALISSMPVSDYHTKLIFTDLTTKTPIKIYDITNTQPLVLSFDTIAQSSNGKFIAGNAFIPQKAKDINLIVVYSLEEEKIIAQLETKHRFIDLITFSPDSRIISAAKHLSKDIELFDIKSGKKIHSIKTKDNVYAMAFSPDGRYLAAACGDEAIVWILLY